MILESTCKKVIRIGFIICCMFFSILSYAQTTKVNSWPKSVIYLGHDIGYPLSKLSFRKKRVVPGRQISMCMPEGGYERAIKKHWMLGVKFGYFRYRCTNTSFGILMTPPIVSNISIENSNEEALRVHVYGKYVFRVKKSFQPYLGAGLGYRWDKYESALYKSNDKPEFTGWESRELRIVFSGGFRSWISNRLAIFNEFGYEHTNELPSWSIGGILNLSK